MLKKYRSAVHNAPSRWLFQDRELASVLRSKHPLVFPDYIAALKDWAAHLPNRYAKYPGVVAGLDRDRGGLSSPFFHFTPSDMICDVDARTIRQSRLRFWIPAHSCSYMNPVGCSFVRALRPDLDPIVVKSKSHSLVVTAEGFVDLNIQALGNRPRDAKAQLFNEKEGFLPLPMGV